MKNTKGFYFTLIVLFCIILLLLVSFQVKREYATEGIKTRILSINNFVKSMERDASRVVYISSYRTMVAVMDYVVSKNKYLEGEYDDREITVNGVFADALSNGSLNYSLGYPEAESILINTSLRDWQERSSILASETNLNLSFIEIDPDKLTVTQSDPWNLIISIPIEYNISDPISKVSWHRNSKLNTTLSIVNTFEDPLYLLEFGASCGNKIINGDDLMPLVDSSCDLTNLTKFIDAPEAISGSMYISSTHGPSYLDRLTNNLSCFRTRSCENPNGIESMFKNANPSCSVTNGTSTVVDFRYNNANADVFVTGESRVHLSEEDDIPYYGIDSGCVD